MVLTAPGLTLRGIYLFNAAIMSCQAQMGSIAG
jgi:hypothetical protein